MKIVELRSENFKRLEVVEIVPDGNVVVVSGANAAGKSSVVDSIFLAFQARAMLKNIPQPVRHGQTEAVVTLNLGEYTVVRTIRQDGSTKLKVTTSEGVPVKSPQGVVDGLLSTLCIDPSKFIQLKPDDQVKTLVTLIDTEGFLAENDKQHAAWYEYRTGAGRTRDTNKAVLDATPKPNVSGKLPDPNAAKAALDHWRAIVDHKESLKRQKEELVTKQNSIAEHIAAMQAQLDEVKDELATTVNALEKQPSIGPGDLEGYEIAWRQSIQDLAEFDKVGAWNEAAKAHQDATAKYNEASSNLDTLKTNRQAWLSKATLPVEGLGFDFSVPCVTYNGTPLAQVSSSEQLKVSTAIAMAQDPELRVIRVSDGNCLDKASFAMLADMAERKDFQVWIEKVDESGEMGVYIEDGRVAAVNGEPVQQ